MSAPLPRTSLRLFPVPVLSLAHLAFLAAVAAYLSVFLPAGRGVVMILCWAAVVAEALPVAWRRFFVCELVLMLAGLSSWTWALPAGSDALHALIGMGLATWMLVPARPGFLRWLMSLAIAELLWLGLHGNADSARRAAQLLIPLALGALAVDAWLMGVLGARRAARNRWWFAGVIPWAVGPALAVAALGLLIGVALVPKVAEPTRRPALPTATKTNPNANARSGLNDIIDIGANHGVERDGRVMARMSWEDRPTLGATVYLRGLALAELECVGAEVRWRAAVPNATEVRRPLRADAGLAWLHRLQGGGDTVLLPDGAAGVELDGLASDREGNLFLAGLSTLSKVYRVNVAERDGVGELASSDSSRYRALPDDLAGLPWSVVERPLWRQLKPEAAADAISEALQERCRYAIDSLPTPANGSGGALRTFLFGADADRRGHCQYFATAAATLLRRAGHAARCVIGYASTEFDDTSVTFRGLHAHAWLEVVDSDGRWRRCDPTPAAPLQQTMARLLEQADTPTPTVPSAINTDANTAENAADFQHAQPLNARWWLLIAPGAALTLAVLWWLRRGWRPQDRARAALDAQAESLLRVAVGLGITVTPGSTLTQIAEAVSRATGVDLAQPLSAHLRARFGGGAAAPEWPLAELRAAGNRRR